MFEREEADLHAPALCDLELVSGLRRGVLSGRLPSTRARRALALYLVLPVRRHDHRRLLPRVWELRANFTAYDAAYVALAEQLRAALLTTDDGLARAVRRHLPFVELA